MNEKDLRLELRLAAMEQIIRMLLVDLFARQGNSVEDTRQLIAQMIEKAGSDTTPEAHPALSDMLAGEWEEAMRALLDGVASTLEAAKQREEG